MIAEAGGVICDAGNVAGRLCSNALRLFVPQNHLSFAGVSVTSTHFLRTPSKRIAYQIIALSSATMVHHADGGVLHQLPINWCVSTLRHAAEV